MIVMKFGGTSIADKDSIFRVVEIVKKYLHQKPIVVNSAMGKTTRNLLNVAKYSAAGEQSKGDQLLKEIRDFHNDLADKVIPHFKNSDTHIKLEKYFQELKKLLNGLCVLQDYTLRTQDKFLSYGELISTSIIAAAFQNRSINAKWMDVRKFIITDDWFSHAKPLKEVSFLKINDKIRPVIESGQIPIVQGFIGSTMVGATTTLGFEGSDLTASFIGAALDVLDVQIWKDVPGIMTTDPAIYPEAYTVKQVSFAEVAELTFFGAKVLHPNAIYPAYDKQIPVHVYNSKNPDDHGTEITTKSISTKQIIKSIAYKTPLVLLKIHSNQFLESFDFIKTVFDILDRERIIPYMSATSESHVSLAIKNQETLEHLVIDLSRFADVKLIKNKATITLVGENIKNTPNIPTTVFKQLEGIPIDMISYGASPINFTFMINESDIKKVIQKLHNHFFANPKDMN